LSLACTHKGKVSADEKSTVAPGDNAEDIDAIDMDDDIKDAEGGEAMDADSNKAMGNSQDLADEVKPEGATTPPAETVLPPSQPSNMNESGERVVRYVMVDNTPAFEQADEKSKQVGTYNTGDPVVVRISGDWAEVSDSYFVKSSALSIKIVPHKRSPAWKPSAQR